jgi:hypothetical protein
MLSMEMRRTLNKTVIVTACNFGYVNHLQNFKCFLERLGLKFIVFALDSKASSFIKENMKNVSTFELSGRNHIGEGTSLFRTRQFNLIAERKVEGVLHVLRLGFNVLFLDTDVVLLRDPFHFLLFDNVDYVHTINHICSK